ncbi:MAG: hypothetical protein JXJ19_09535 [Elusimicrobia bacterium]|nr:hypothetical protein [Elusimicrobiota bacterium]
MNMENITKDKRYDKILKNEIAQLTKLVDIDSPNAVLEEVKCIFIQNYHVKDFLIMRKVFKDFITLYNGLYPGYKKCNTPYHDINHSMDTFLAYARLVDGYNIREKPLPVKSVVIGLIAVLFHDSGYIQKKNDNVGTGAKYTKNHEKRSMEFLKKYFRLIGFDEKSYELSCKMVRCTDLKEDASRIRFGSNDEKILAHIVGTADLIGQMASRTYLENLSYLYREFKESQMPGYDSEMDLLRNTVKFYDNIAKIKLKNELGGLFEYARDHFAKRYGIDRNLYVESIEKQLGYLTMVMETAPRGSYKEKLRRKRKKTKKTGKKGKNHD